mmetsp:Transcript_1121/g.869  ORF Transcript_1121/g.869 Transcript_1121/m.869 type:complete len:106 (-) Transcript_1121:120-437(-)
MSVRSAMSRTAEHRQVFPGVSGGAAATPTAHAHTAVVASSASNSTGASWPWPDNWKARPDDAHSDAAAQRAAAADRKALEGILTELRKEVESLDEDAWMYKKLPF